MLSPSDQWDQMQVGLGMEVVFRIVPLLLQDIIFLQAQKAGPLLMADESDVQL